MTKRTNGINKSSPSKRKKSTDNIASKFESPTQDRSTAGNAELLRCLDQADNQDGPVFNVTNPPIRKGVRSTPGVCKDALNLNGQNYFEARYAVEARDKWLSMAKYRNLYVSHLASNPRSSLTLNSTIGNQSYSCGDCVCVNSGTDSGRDWKAQVHEVRAADEHHVFLRCTWLENPEELPEKVLSTPSYHGKFELVPSNKMDIIDALTVIGPLEIAYWEESNEDADMSADGGYYWRQTYNHDTKVLSVSNSYFMLQLGYFTDSRSH
jgi:hypothetical protein